MHTNSVPALLSKNIGNSLTNYKTWGSIIFNVKEFKAKGDGVTDDTAFVQDAINAAGANGGGIVYFPSGGTYLTSSLTVGDPNVLLYLDHCTLKTDGISITGAKSGIQGNGATIDGRSKVKALTAATASGGTVLTFGSGHPFVVGDGIQSSYGLGGDGGNPITVTSVTSTTVTVATPTSAILPIGAYVGTYQFSATVGLFGDKSYVKSVEIVNSRGYAISSTGSVTTYVEGVRVYNNGLDCVNLKGPTFYVKDSYFGFIYDAAKQGISIGETSSLILDSVTFQRDTYDPDIFIYGTNVGTAITARDCVFNGTSSGTHPAPYSGNGWAAVNIGMNAGSSLGNILFSRCTFTNLAQGIITKTAGDVTVMSMGIVIIEDSQIFSCALNGNLNNMTWTDYIIRNCLFDGQSTLTNAVNWATNSDSITLQGCTIQNDNTMKTLFYFELIDVTFISCTNLFLNETSVGERCRFVQTPVSGYLFSDNTSILRLSDSYISHTGLTTGGTDISAVLNLFPKPGGTMEFTILNGTLKAVAYNFNFNTNYYVIVQTIDGTIRGLMGDDWNVPIFSIVENVRATTTATRYLYVSKSNQTTLSASAASGATSIVVTSATGFAANDYINIALTDGRVHCTKVGAGYVGGTTIPLTTALPSAAAAGKGVCDFLY